MGTHHTKNNKTQQRANYVYISWDVTSTSNPFDSKPVYLLLCVAYASLSQTPRIFSIDMIINVTYRTKGILNDIY